MFFNKNKLLLVVLQISLLALLGSTVSAAPAAGETVSGTIIRLFSDGSPAVTLEYEISGDINSASFERVTDRHDYRSYSGEVYPGTFTISGRVLVHARDGIESGSFSIAASHQEHARGTATRLWENYQQELTPGTYYEFEFTGTVPAEAKHIGFRISASAVTKPYYGGAGAVVIGTSVRNFSVRVAEAPSPAPPTPGPATVLADPGTLTKYRGQNEAIFRFQIQGSTSGNVWGTDVYTDDSRLAAAAVHAGVLRAGETGIVTVQILPGQSSYSGSTRFGVTSRQYGSWTGSYKFLSDTSRSFSDLPTNHWAYENIMEMVEMGILSGYPDGTFRPNNTISRAEFAKIMVLALQLETTRPAAPTFTDVATSHWAYEVVESARNYLTGYRDTRTGELTFEPSSVAVREDVAVAIVKAKGFGNAPANLSLLNQFPDREQISPALRNHVAIAVEKGYMRGTDRGFEPQKALTRAEACALLSRIMVREDEGEKEKITF